jgi:hypothetical protein
VHSELHASLDPQLARSRHTANMLSRNSTFPISIVSFDMPHNMYMYIKLTIRWFKLTRSDDPTCLHVVRLAWVRETYMSASLLAKPTYAQYIALVYSQQACLHASAHDWIVAVMLRAERVVAGLPASASSPAQSKFNLSYAQCPRSQVTTALVKLIPAAWCEYAVATLRGCTTDCHTCYVRLAACGRW